MSAGSSGAILVGGQFVVGRIKGIKRAPLGAVMPTAKGPMLLVDAGANMDAKAEYLLQFAQMGSIYMEDVLGIKNPRVGLVKPVRLLHFPDEILGRDRVCICRRRVLKLP